MIVEFECGHTKQVMVEGRERKKMRENPGICPDCRTAAIKEANEVSAKQAKEAGLRDLDGTPKQVAWANTIRRDMIDMVNKNSAILNDDEKELCVKFLQSIDSASRFINARYASIEAILEQAKKEVK